MISFCIHNYKLEVILDPEATYKRVVLGTCKKCGKQKLIEQKCDHDWEVLKEHWEQSKWERMKISEVSNCSQSQYDDLTVQKVTTEMRCRSCGKHRSDYRYEH